MSSARSGYGAAYSTQKRKYVKLAVRTEGNKYFPFPVIFRKSSNNSNACRDRGTICCSSIFMRSAGMRHSAFGKSNSAQTAQRNSLGRTKTKGGKENGQARTWPYRLMERSKRFLFYCNLLNFNRYVNTIYMNTFKNTYDFMGLYCPITDGYEYIRLLKKNALQHSFSPTSRMRGASFGASLAQAGIIASTDKQGRW